MFESSTYRRLREAAQQAAGRRGEIGLATDEQLCDALRDVQAAVNLLDGVRADLFARLDDTDGYTGDGASSVAGFSGT